MKRTLLLPIALLPLALAGLVGSASTPPIIKEIHEFKGVLECDVAAAGQSFDADCPAKGGEAEKFVLALRPGLFKVQLMLTWAAATVQSTHLAMTFSEPVDDGKTTYWEGKSGELVVFDVAQERVRDPMKWTVLVGPAKDPTQPAIILDQTFGLQAVLGYYGPASEPGAPPTEHPSPLQSSSKAAASGSTSPQQIMGRVPWPSVALVSIGAGFALMPRNRRLVVAALLPLFSRLDDDAVLDHPRRSLLATLVRAQPGLPAESVRRRLGLANGPFEHHLRILVRHGIVQRKALEGHVYLFPDRAAAAQPHRAPTIGAMLLEAVRAEPGQSQIDLSRRLKVPEKNLRYHALTLARQGRLRLEPDGRAVRCYPVDSIQSRHQPA